MYNVLNTIVGMLMVGLALNNSESAPLWDALLVVGGLYIGHALTEALNNPTDQSE